jgi:hypothetical protein
VALLLAGLIFGGCTRDAADDGKPSTRDQLRALLSVQANSNPKLANRAADLPTLEKAVDILRRDTSAGAESRRRRALATILAHAWNDGPDPDLLARLGIADFARVKQVLVDHYSSEVLGLFDDDPAWREFVIMRALADDPKMFALIEPSTDGWFTQLAYAQGGGDLCWRPEGPSRTEFIDPAVTIQTFISIAPTTSFAQVKENIDPQHWDECSKFWSPPPDASYLAVIAQPTPPGCNLTEADLAHPSPNPSSSPGADQYDGRVFEHFQCQTAGCSAWFKNLLKIAVGPEQVKPYPGGTPIPSHLITYWLPTCRGTEKNGFMSGAILNQPRRVILDEGWMEAWEQEGRTYLKTFKKVQFEGAASTWVAAMILEMTELNKETGELACCERDG